MLKLSAIRMWFVFTSPSMSAEGWAAIAVAIATFVLVGATIYYAKQTKRMAESADQLRRDAVRPMLTGDLGLTTDVGTVPNPRVKLRNSGAGPASNVGIRFDNPAHHRFYEEWLPALGTHEESSVIGLRHRASGGLSEGHVDEISSLVVEYDDIFGTSFRTTFRTQQAFIGWQNLDVTTEQIKERSIHAPVSTGWQTLREALEQ